MDKESPHAAAPDATQKKLDPAGVDKECEGKDEIQCGGVEKIQGKGALVLLYSEIVLVFGKILRHVFPMSFHLSNISSAPERAGLGGWLGWDFLPPNVRFTYLVSNIELACGT